MYCRNTTAITTVNTSAATANTIANTSAATANTTDTAPTR